MSFMSFFANNRERRVAMDEAAAALEKHGAGAEEVLRAKASQAHSGERRRIYRLAASHVRRQTR
jgi:hypothetical protein